MTVIPITKEALQLRDEAIKEKVDFYRTQNATPQNIEAAKKYHKRIVENAWKRTKRPNDHWARILDEEYGIVLEADYTPADEGMAPKGYE